MKILSKFIRFWYNLFRSRRSKSMIEIFSPQTIANYFIRKAKETGTIVTHIKLQKLVYISHGWSLALLNKPLVNKSFEAWRYGPVSSPLYSSLKYCGKNPIVNQIANTSESISDIDSNENVKKLLDVMWTRYGSLSGIVLSAMTHQKGTPWSKTTSEAVSIDPDISDVEIKTHYEGLAKIIETGEAISE